VYFLLFYLRVCQKSNMIINNKPAVLFCRNNLIKFLKSKKIFLNVHYIPVHYHPFYKNLNINKKVLKNSEKYFNQAISLPIYVGLKKDEQIYVSKCINKFIKNYT